MRKNFLEWLQDYAVHAGLVGLIEGMLAALAFAGAFSTLFGTTAIKAGAMVGVIFAVLGLIALLSFNRVELNNQVELHRNLLARYCTIIAERSKHAYRTMSWNDVFVISPNGDVRETITVRAIVECDELDFYKIYTGPGWYQPERYRDGVRAKVRSLEVEGVGGARRDVTTSWSEKGNLEIIAHFGEPAHRDSEISLQVELDWPGRCIPLMRRRVPAEFALTFTSPLPYLEYRIVLPIGFDAYHDVIGLVRGPNVFESSRRGGDGRNVEVKLVARDIAKGQRVGLRLDLK